MEIQDKIEQEQAARPREVQMARSVIMPTQSFQSSQSAVSANELEVALPG